MAEPENESMRFAKAPHLWALGVGAVISGDFFGWQSGLKGGFMGLVVCLCVVSVLYLLLSFSIAELSTMFPSGGGPYVFAQKAMGPTAGFFAGLAESLKVIITCSVVAVGIGFYVCELLKIDSESYGPIWWAVFYLLFVVLNIAGVELSFKAQFGFTVLSVVVLVVFYVGAAFVIDYEKWVVEQDWVFSDGVTGVMKSFSFALWFYLGIEELPLAVEETIDPATNMPIGLISSILSLLVISFCTLFFNSAISPGAKVIYESTSPLLVGYESVFGDNSTTSSLSWILIVGLLSSFHSFIFCMGRLLMAIARDGFLPAPLAWVHPTRKTPYMGLIVGSALGLAVALILHFAIGDTDLGSVLMNLALIGALISYSFQLVSFIILRLQKPDLPRPYRSGFGLPGAVISLVLSIFIFGTILYSGFEDQVFIASVITAAAYFILGGVYFYVFVKGNHHIDESSRISHGLLSNDSLKEKNLV